MAVNESSTLHKGPARGPFLARTFFGLAYIERIFLRKRQQLPARWMGRSNEPKVHCCCFADRRRAGVRAGSYHVARLIPDRGRDGKVIDWLDEITADLPVATKPYQWRIRGI
jgi:hypothetical protein